MSNVWRNHSCKACCMFTSFMWWLKYLMRRAVKLLGKGFWQVTHRITKHSIMLLQLFSKYLILLCWPLTPTKSTRDFILSMGKPHVTYSISQCFTSLPYLEISCFQVWFYNLCWPSKASVPFNDNCLQAHYTTLTNLSVQHFVTCLAMGSNQKWLAFCTDVHRS